jgi:hypothetical protein|tara:strand:- start:277 stop:840 length:564 start_codon:yes stop_codon:yes gene_type:complete
MKKMKKFLPIVMLLTLGTAANAGGLSTRHQSSLQLTVEPQIVTQTRIGNSYSISGNNVITTHTPANGSAVDGGIGINTYSATTGVGTVGTITGVQNGCTGSSADDDLACAGSFSFAQSWQQGDNSSAAAASWGDITTQSAGTAGTGAPGTITNGHTITINQGTSSAGTLGAGNSLTGQFVSEITIFD